MDIITKTLAHAPGDDPLDYVMSDDSVDRLGDVIDAKGWVLENFNKNPIALFSHDSKLPIGRWTNVRIEGNTLRGRLELIAAETSERMREIHAFVKAGILRAVSVGFKPLASEPAEKGMRFTKSELVECSLVSIPANPNALMLARALDLSPTERSLFFAEPGDGTVTTQPGEPAVRPPIRKGRAMTLAEKIAASEARQNQYRDQIAELANKIGDAAVDQETMDASDELDKRLADEVLTHSTLKKVEKNLMFSTAATQPVVTAPAIIQGQTKSIDRVGDYVIRGLLCKLVGKIQERTPLEVMEERYPNDRETKELFPLVTRAASAPATTTTSGWLSQLVETSSVDFLDTLLAASVYPGLAAAGPKFTFGRSGIISIPSRVATPTVGGSFVAQGSPIPVRQAAVTTVTITPRKMGVISTFTREIAEHSTPSAEALIKQFMQEDTAIAIDSVLLDATAETTTRPQGLRAGVGATTATAGGGFAALVGDLKALVGVLTAANSLRNPVFIMNPVEALSISLTTNTAGDMPFQAEIAQGRLLGYRVIQSTSVTAKMVLLVEAADFFSATSDTANFQVSDTATLHMEDTTPLAIGTAGSPPTVAAPTRSLFQTDTMAVRMLLDINWVMRRTGVISWTQTVTW